MVRRGTKAFRFRKIDFIFLLFFMFLSPSASIATTIWALTFEEILQYAEFVFEGRAIAVETVTPPDSRLPRTCVTFEISEVLKGRPPDDTVDLCFLGGVSGKYTVRVANMKYPQLDEKGIYFVQSLERQYANPLHGWEQGHFIIETDPHTSREYVVTAGGRPVTGVTVEGAPPRGLSTGVAIGVKTANQLQIEKAWTVAEFKQKVRSMLGVMK